MPQEYFQRYELKYVLTHAQYSQLLAAIIPFMKYDQHSASEGKYNVVSLYFESFDNKVYNETVNRALFRQKLRLRVYDQADLTSNAFIEIKQKYKKVVNKRRTILPLQNAYEVLYKPYDEKMLNSIPASNKQILHEALFFKSFYNLFPTLIVSYDRQALSGTRVGEEDLRVTFDYNLICRSHDLAVEAGPYGKMFTDPDTVILEIKVSQTVPFWLARILSDFEFTRQGFSKFCRSVDLLDTKSRKPLSYNSEVLR